jgi:hypothetical protein
VRQFKAIKFLKHDIHVTERMLLSTSASSAIGEVTSEKAGRLQGTARQQVTIDKILFANSSVKYANQIGVRNVK